jgi:predicted dehydrogenase
MEVAVAAADSGARGVFCEKPLADSLPNGRKLVEACESRNVSLAVNHLRRWDKAHQEVRSFLAQGKLGSLQHTTVHYTRGVANYGSHVADLLRFFFGEVDWVRAFNRLKEPDHDPSLDAYMRMRNGMGCALVSCPRDSLDVFDLDIIGSTGRLRIEEFGHTIRLHRVATQPEFPRRQAFIEASSPFSPSLRGMMLAAVDDLVGCVAQRKKTPLCTGQDGLAALEIVTALERSAAGDGEQVNLPLG